ncbi:MAG: MMPL family transporter, partial [Cytophagales bacterium]
VYLPEPSIKKMKHLDSKILNKIIEWSLTCTFKYKNWVYALSAFVLLVSVIGTLKIKTLSFMTDDVPERLGIQDDLVFFEENFKGVMPIEFIVDTGKKKALMNLKNLKTIEEFERFLKEQPYLSAPISANTFLKASVQTFYGGDTNSFILPTNNDKPFIMSYLNNMDNDKNKKSLLSSFVDSSGQQLRISCKISDMGSVKIDSFMQHVLIPKADSIFKPKNFDYKITGSTLLFVRGNNLLIDSLYGSIVQSVIFCSILMAMLFASFRMIVITLIQNFIPILFTAAIMGFFSINLKPSTAIIFSVVFGIAIDNSIHFLAKYRHEIFHKKLPVREALKISMIEAGPSMIYTSVILFIGFIIFTFSSFGGTVYLGILTSITLLTTLIASLTLLPCLILDFDRGKKEKDFEPVIEKFEGLYVEEDNEDVDVSDLEREENSEKNSENSN